MENAQPEPSMEEILASIRKIISEDEEDQSAPAQEKPQAQARPAEASPSRAEPEAPRAPEPEMREAREPSREPMASAAVKPAEAPEEPMLEPEPESAETMKQNVAAAMENQSEEDILDRTTAEVASQAFKNLSQSIRVSEGPGKTLEDIVTEMLRPMIKEWLDANLPAIVEEKVEEEVQRVARRRR